MDGDHSALLHFGYIIDFSKAITYAQKHDILRDPETGRSIDWNNPPEYVQDEFRCMMDIVHFLSYNKGFIFRYATVMGPDAPAHVVSLYNNQETHIRRAIKVKRTMHLMTVIEEAFDEEDQLPMWWWDAETCGVGYVNSALLREANFPQCNCSFKSRLPQYNPPPPPPSKPLKMRAGGCRAMEAQLQADFAQLSVS